MTCIQQALSEPDQRFWKKKLEMTSADFETDVMFISSSRTQLDIKNAS